MSDCEDCASKCDMRDAERELDKLRHSRDKLAEAVSKLTDILQKACAGMPVVNELEKVQELVEQAENPPWF